MAKPLTDADIAKLDAAPLTDADIDKSGDPPRMTWPEKIGAAAKQIGSAAIAPIAGIPDAVRSVADFLQNPNAWAKKHFDPAQAQNLPGMANENPVDQAAGVVAPMALGVAGEKIAPGVKAAGTAIADVATSPAVVQGLKRGTEGAVIGSAMHGNLPGVAGATAGRIAETRQRGPSPSP